MPSSTEIAQKISQTTDETTIIQKPEAARELQLTTPVPMQTIFYTNGNMCTLKMANQTVKLKHINPSKLITAGTFPGLAISTLYPNTRKTITIEKINQYILSL